MLSLWLIGSAMSVALGALAARFSNVLVYALAGVPVVGIIVAQLVVGEWPAALLSFIGYSIGGGVMMVLIVAAEKIEAEEKVKVKVISNEGVS